MKICKAWLLPTVIVALLVPTAAAQAAGGISGTVTAVGGGALEGISVCARDQSFTPHCATTGAGGEYEIESLEGKYRVKFEGGDDYVDRWFADAAFEGEAEFVNVSGHLTEGVDAELPLAGKIEGTVTDATIKAGIQNVSVCPFRESNPIGLECTTTDADGHYTLGGLPADSYTVSFSAAFEGSSRDYLSELYKDSPSTGNATPVAVTEGSTASGIDAALAKGARITGTVTDESDQPVQGVTVCAEAAKPRPEFGPCGFSDADGTYTIYRVASDKYRVSFSPNPFSGNFLKQYFDDKPSRKLADTVVATAPATVTGIDATLHPGGRIEGTITDALTGDPISLARACAVLVGAEGGGNCVPSSPSGTYTIASLPTGTYEVTFSGGFGGSIYASERYDDLSIDETGTPVKVTAGAAVTGIDGALVHGGTVRGTVTSDATELPIQSIEVCAFRDHEEEGRCIFTSASGEYEFTGLDAGSYAIRFRPGTPFGPGQEPSDPAWITQWYSGQTTRASAQQLDVAPGGTFEEVDAEMVTGGRISGTITGPGGVPIRTGFACAIPSGGEEERCGFADKNGSYQIQGLAPGSYEVRFDSNPINGNAGWLPEFWDDQPSAATADEVEVTGGATEEIDAELQGAGGIAGRVTAADSGAPLSAFVCAIPDGETESSNCAEASANGKYLIPRLPSGGYRVEFSVLYFEGSETFEEFTTQFYKGAASLGTGTVVSVTAGSITGSIDAAMVEPGTEPEPPDPEGGGQPTGDPPAAPIPPAAALPAAPRPQAKKPHCGKGKKAKKVRGKWRCVKKQNKKKAKPRHKKGR